MLSGCSQSIRAHSHAMWAGEAGYSQPMWARIDRCYRAGAFRFSGRYKYRPPHRVIKLTSRNFAWRTDGPVHKFFVTRFVPEYFQSAFGTPGDAFRFVGGTLSPESLARFAISLERLASEFESLARHDARLPLDRRNGCSAILAVRSWEFSEFTRLRRRSVSRDSRTR